ncbi:MAG: IS110 family transposase [Cyanobacteria bacterium SZAS LIN-5]|nr:IS110 family transposase [Cyanobacteria bacterium SZAS LIN-5]
MYNTRIALGLDVSKLTIDACLLRPDGVRQTMKISNDISGFHMLLNWLQDLDLSSIHACLEPTGTYSRSVSYYLAEVGIKVSLVNSFAVQSHGRSKKIRSKTDRIDAFLLADYCLKENPETWIAPTKAQSELRDLQHRLDCVKAQIRQEQNRLEAGSDSKLVLEDIEESLGRLLVRQRKLEKAIKQLVLKDERLATDFKILNSIIGIGDTSALQMLALIRFDQFENGRQVACFAGLTPKMFESGSSIHKKTHISRIGSSQLRRSLYFPAMVAMQHNPQLRTFADQLKAKGKPSKVIICAVMRKLLVLATALIRTGKMYDPHHLSPAAAAST